MPKRQRSQVQVVTQNEIKWTVSKSERTKGKSRRYEIRTLTQLEVDGPKFEKGRFKINQNRQNLLKIESKSKRKLKNVYTLVSF